MGMMRLSVAALAVVGFASPAAAGGFGGFADGAYRADDSICTPLSVDASGAASGRPACRSADAKALAAGGFRRARSGGLRASHQGRALTVRDPEGRVLVRWQAPAPVERVLAVYRSEAGTQVAVDYAVRRLGRSNIETVGFALRRSAATAKDGAGPDRAAAGEPAAGSTVANGAARARGEALLDRRKYAAAAAALQAVVDADGGDLRARYALARALARSRKREAAIAQLAAIARSQDPTAVEYLVDARRERDFARLRKAAGFRSAIALDPARPKSAYERLVGAGTTWVQRVDPCNEAGVRVELDPQTREFSLRIDIRCAASKDRVFLGGTWTARGSDELVLVFPNDDQEDETVVCKLQPCEGGADCVACALDDGLSFDLRRAAR